MIKYKCTVCNIEKSEDSFYKRKKELKDGTISIKIGQYKCKQCSAKYKREKYPYERKIHSEEELKQSYVDRAVKIKKALSNKKERDIEEIRAKISRATSKPLRAVNIMNGEVLVFNSGLDAETKSNGKFINTSISRAIAQGRPYLGYFWSFA